MPATSGLPAGKRHDAAARAKGPAPVSGQDAGESQVCATRPAIARSAAVTSPGDMIAPGETPNRRSLAISDDARL